jgi:hypothetical protein
MRYQPGRTSSQDTFVDGRIAGFSLNGELMMDLMGQEIAFKGIDVGEPYVPAFSLGAGQHAKINFGQVRRMQTQTEYIFEVTALDVNHMKADIDAVKPC